MPICLASALILRISKMVCPRTVQLGDEGIVLMGVVSVAGLSLGPLSGRYVAREPPPTAPAAGSSDSCDSACSLLAVSTRAVYMGGVMMRSNMDTKVLLTYSEPNSWALTSGTGW